MADDNKNEQQSAGVDPADVQGAEEALDAQTASGAPGASEPETEEVTEAQEPTGEAADAAEGAQPASREDKLLDELQRLAAEYKNYRARTEAQAVIERQRAAGETAKRLFPVFDDLDRAEQAGDLAEGSAFATIASKLRGVAEGLGLERFGAKGEPFDPKVHEAVLQQPNPDVTELVIGEVVTPGYRIGETLLRAAKVVVFAPAE
ncbi:nucleotide exchange factor GrpE [Pseudoclavibacter soli]|uniref:nucleotide exchange factor GrpE n=1 Tax=Pseudoclavibacter soli TaxID=452623 RepID=UPI00041B175C|nr:nucleotide exchange factor GrpE [Pseudoclavibacter soli]